MAETETETKAEPQAVKGPEGSTPAEWPFDCCLKHPDRPAVDCGLYRGPHRIFCKECARKVRARTPIAEQQDARAEDLQERADRAEAEAREARQGLDRLRPTLDALVAGSCRAVSGVQALARKAIDVAADAEDFARQVRVAGGLEEAAAAPPRVAGPTLNVLAAAPGCGAEFWKAAKRSRRRALRKQAEASRRKLLGRK